MGWMDDAMVELRPWIGQVRVTEDDVGLMAVRRAAGTFDLDPASFRNGSELPPHWFTFIGTETVVQGELRLDGHAKPGVVLPPIPMPRRMGAGRRVKITGRLRAGEPAVKKAEVVDIVPKTGRSGDIFVLTMRNTY
jgi:3-methylfumaryl-CoA hydratase